MSYFKRYKRRVMLKVLQPLLYRAYKLTCVIVSSTGKVYNSCIRDLGFNPCLHKKFIDVLDW